ncbi:acyl carrier protein [Streptomyces sp. ISL-11]|uniref:acyl carrier protein n=1 Tax=Streptomyces sp. ISL-11 TaxID=2819174 RepID=UPI001BE8C655|nr:acyl carrier protein [Streptomyces sp. ISL-11]MBT2383220.1 acyl carrier protein [Streptomyces sp. ISL-11]
MTAPTTEPAPEPAVRAELLDCLQANLGLLADRLHGPGTHLRLGARLGFAPRPGQHGLPTVEPSLDDHLADARDLLGLVVESREQGVPGTKVAATDELLYVVADAYHLPWGPYFGNKHVEHSFLVEPEDDGTGITVSDAYHNDTQWGRARPVQLRYERAELAAALDAIPEGAEVVRLTAGPLGDAPAPERTLDARCVTDYLRAFTEHTDRPQALEQFTLETWLLARTRRLHAAYAAGAAGAEPRLVREHLARWDGLVEHAYLAFRRVARGRAEPPELLDRAGEVLHADATALGGTPSEARTEGEHAAVDDRLRATVREVVASVLGLDEDQLPETELTGLPAFSSLRMVEIVECLETEFQVEFEAADLVPEKLHRISDLCALVGRALDGPRP